MVIIAVTSEESCPSLRLRSCRVFSVVYAPPFRNWFASPGHPVVRRLTGFAADLLCVVVFVAIGRSTHDHGLAPTGVLSTLWPFATGLAVGWIFIIRRGRSGASLGDAALIVIATVTVGMILRVLAGQGTALAFIIVSLLFLALTFGGWRIVLRTLSRRRR